MSLVKRSDSSTEYSIKDDGYEIYNRFTDNNCMVPGYCLCLRVMKTRAIMTMRQSTGDRNC